MINYSDPFNPFDFLHREPDLSYVPDTMDSLLPCNRVRLVASLENTTYPGKSDEKLKQHIENTGQKVGKNE